MQYLYLYILFYIYIYIFKFILILFFVYPNNLSYLNIFIQKRYVFVTLIQAFLSFTFNAIDTDFHVIEMMPESSSQATIN